MFRSIIFLIAANFVSRGFYTVAIIVLAETYSADVFAEIIFTATVLLFLSAIGPLRFELAILDKESADQNMQKEYNAYSLSIEGIFSFNKFLNTRCRLHLTQP